MIPDCLLEVILQMKIHLRSGCIVGRRVLSNSFSLQGSLHFLSTLGAQPWEGASGKVVDNTRTLIEIGPGTLINIYIIYLFIYNYPKTFLKAPPAQGCTTLARNCRLFWHEKFFDKTVFPMIQPCHGWVFTRSVTSCRPSPVTPRYIHTYIHIYQYCIITTSRWEA